MRTVIIIALFAVFMNIQDRNTFAEEISPNQAYCAATAKARVHIVKLLCKGVSSEKLTQKIRDEYPSVQGDVLDDIVESESDNLDEARCKTDPKSIFKSSFEACYSALSTMSGE